MANVLVFAEVRAGDVRKVALEAVTEETLQVAVPALDRSSVPRVATGSEKARSNTRVAAWVRRSSSRRPVSEVARLVGFRSSEAFSRFVRRTLGRPPSALR